MKEACTEPEGCSINYRKWKVLLKAVIGDGATGMVSRKITLIEKIREGGGGGGGVVFCFFSLTG